MYDHDDIIKLPEHIQILRTSEIQDIPGVPGAQIVAAPWHHKQPLKDLCASMLKALPSIEDGAVRIAVAHGQLDSLSPDGSNPALISKSVVQQALAEKKIHYLALGDRHSVTDADQSGRIWYSGTPVATDFTEVTPNQVLLVDASVGIDPRPQVQQIAVGNWQFKQLNETVESGADVERLAALLDAIENKECTVIKLALQGALKFDENVALETMLENHRRLFASLRIHARHTDLAVLPDRIESEALGVSGYARSCWDELAATATEEGPEAETARRALQLFYRIASAPSRLASR